MDITPQNDQQPISDDQELAKALAGVLPDVDEPAVLDTTPAVEIVGTTTAPEPETPEEPAAIQFHEAPVSAEPVVPEITLPEPVEEAPSISPSPSGSANLEGIKKDALEELRPLIDRVDLPAEEKFDTYLMLIRSTDDSALIGPAHAAAQGIADETRRAEALLDIIKEIDYLSRNNQAA